MAVTNNPLHSRRIGFIATRLTGTDGVSLETQKWDQVLRRMGHTCFYFSGESDWMPERSRIVPEAHFLHPTVEETYLSSFSQRTRPADTSRKIHQLREYLKERLYEFLRDFDIELMIVENALTIPLNLPLGLALTELIAETGFPVIAHHHDFFWERKRFLVNNVWDYLNMAFPPHLPSIQHVVINSLGSSQLSLRTGISSSLIPNVMDFDRPPPPPDEYARDIRSELGLTTGELLLLQPTRVVPRKGIEHAIELTRRIGRRACLVITHASGDEGTIYEQHLREYAAHLGVRVNFAAHRFGTRRGRTQQGEKIYTIWDAYGYADLVTYPSDLEGFGNAFLEAVYFRKPIVINNYSIYSTDIKPKGFRVIEFDGYLTEDTVTEALRVIDEPALAEVMAETNYRLARNYYSYAMLERRLQTLLAECFGEE